MTRLLLPLCALTLVAGVAHAKGSRFGPGVDAVMRGSTPFAVRIGPRTVKLYQARKGKGEPTVRVGQARPGKVFVATKIRTVKRGSRNHVSYRIDWGGKRVWIKDVTHWRATSPRPPKAFPKQRAFMAIINQDVRVYSIRGATADSPVVAVLGVAQMGQVYAVRAAQRNWAAIQFNQEVGWVDLDKVFLMRDGLIPPYQQRGGAQDGPLRSLLGGLPTAAPARGAFDPRTQDHTGRNDAMAASESERTILARIVKGECNIRIPREGRVAVAAVVLNRVRDRRWPNTIQKVAHQPLQFSCYNRDQRATLYWGSIPSWAFEAADAALAGEDPSYGSNHYYNPFLVSPSWAKNLTFVRRIGTDKFTAHDFFK